MRNLSRLLTALIGGLIVGFAAYAHHSYKKSELIANRYDDVQIGSPVEEVTYLFGDPKYVSKSANHKFQYQVDGKGDLPPIPVGSTVSDFSEWEMDTTDDGYTLYISLDQITHRLKSVMCEQFPWEKDNCPLFLTMKTGSPEDEVLAKFGQPDKIEFENGEKTLHYFDFGLDVGLWRGKVKSLKKSQSSSFGIAKIAANEAFGLPL